MDAPTLKTLASDRLHYNRQRDIHAMRCTYRWSDHRMIRSQMCLNVQPSRHRCSAKPRTKLDVAKLKSTTIQQHLAEKLNTIFEEDIEPAKRFNDGLKAVYVNQSCGTKPLMSANGTTRITDQSEILKRWAEHFNDVLN